ncbi:hypothetical protein [Arthrobacter sp. StoSoilB13]|uniref:hypothetical protein n=1 Tax=Arthrobacter sp. StoSoilB13 TaxID=2830993 RepID=UPI001CC5DA21|nr:hypothetical protein [Arthrobacter sp. StoSoilB13]BCW52175.1 hypothetical protein StoSoilB13_45170 [Arthrobacter sp. StoSoilB13]
MSNNNGVPQPPYNPDGVPQPRYETGQEQYRQYQPGQTQPMYRPEAQEQQPPLTQSAAPGQDGQTQALPAQQFPTQQGHPDGEFAETVHRYPQAQQGQPGFPPPGSGYPGQPGYPDQQASGQPGYPGQPGGPSQGPGDHNKKALFLILGGIAVVVIIALVVVFAWLIPSVTKPVAVETPVPSTSASDGASDAAAEPSNEPSADATASSEIPEGAIPLPSVWEEFAGPTNVPADGDPLFSKWVTGESSFQYLAEWTHDESFGITKDPTTGEEIQKKAQGTVEADGDGIALAYAFFAESDEGKFGKDPKEIKAAIEDIEARYKGMTATELPQNLVGHKCTSDFKTSMPEIREFRRGAAVVIGFTCTNARGEEIQAVNLFSVTPWGTPQMLGVSGHKTYWDAHPGLMEQLANSYRINKWKMV